MPKKFANVSPPKVVPDGGIRYDASMWGRLPLRIDMAGPVARNPAVRILARRQINRQPCPGYRYIASLDAPPDADYPTLAVNPVEIDRLWLGKTGLPGFGQGRTIGAHLIKQLFDALRTLTVNGQFQAMRPERSAVRSGLFQRFQLAYSLKMLPCQSQLNMS